MKRKIVSLPPVRYSKAIASVYARELSELIKGMVKDCNVFLTIYKDKKGQIANDAVWMTTEVEERFNKLGNKWKERFEEFAKNKPDALIKKILKQTDLQLKSSLKNYLASEYFMLIGNTVPVQLRIIMKASVAENVSLIKSIPSKFFEQIEGVVYRAITGRLPIDSIRKELLKYGNITLRRAKLISDDQTTKAFNVLAVERMKQVGITKYQWLHTGRGKTHRPYHKRKWDGVSGLKDGHPNGLNGFIFDMNKLPIIDEKTGERGIAGQLPFCHCLIAPVVVYD